MHASQLFSAITLASLAAFGSASPIAMAEGEASGLVTRQDSCNAAPVSAEYDFSYYTFHIDANVQQRAKAAGLTKIGVLQKCDSNGGIFGSQPKNTENWAYAPLDKFGPDQKYKIKVNRCKKDYDRHVWKYQVWLCNENNWCGTTNCGLDRDICPTQKTKSVDLVDNEAWLCSA
ncbi:hypothetical protein CGCF415_v015382 [Colletotrichum fructicola]|uniref:Secreted protein n=1 Tax=Colletotrichum fructicola (strain Nara gc5) TaxID=1213859 RepID=A0A7J6IXZ8_COLFN|nr:uncharacterized protein CGMCC3_g5481 [Colletotrichum fructicola]KAF4480831.1 hypothetical protein CGGC5_v011491 [Colletotrichum fructicola Nara gc5]KAF4819776.1 hypothetical protein CGCTS75_v011556 [Colletotrichum tropicale]KAI8272709.1 hypothetical protein K4K60_012026 [Colletotrichum sp. SAR11_57]KAE9578405.1 hypothetical protein CGMCC3_g5481 [Colletotrichum fructicola]KAF4426494.1 hypothetical protein CFRS1_v009821 [Colletotrichum fructicola]